MPDSELDVTPLNGATPLKWHGGKTYLAKNIVALMPPRVKKPNAPDPNDPGYVHFVEGCCGGCQVLLENDPNGISEVVNDLNDDLMNFWSVMKDIDAFVLFYRKIAATPFSEVEFKRALEYECLVDHLGMPCIECAVAFFTVCRQSLSGRMKGFTGITKVRTRKGMNGEAAAWWGAVDDLPMVHQRLRGIVIFCEPVIKCIRRQDGKRTLYYLDPPYLPEVRVTTGEYEHEMGPQGHADLLVTLCGAVMGDMIEFNGFEGIVRQDWWKDSTPIEGRFMLSGYRTPLYDLMDNLGIRRVDFDLPNHSSSKREKDRRVESIWLNYQA